jgi:hypothetical protein
VGWREEEEPQRAPARSTLSPSQHQLQHYYYEESTEEETVEEDFELSVIDML